MRDNTKRINPAAYTKSNSRAERSEQEKNVTVPSFYVDLPSRGIFYPKDHPLHNKEKIEIKEMTAREEEILSSQEHSKAGTTMDKFMDAVIVDLDIKPNSILLADRAAIIYHSRCRAYNNQIHLPKYECPSCNHEQKIKAYANFVVEDKDYSSFDNAIVNIDGFVEFTLSNGVTLEMKAFDIETENEIVKFISENPDKSFVNLLIKTAIRSLDGNKDKQEIKEAVLDLPAKDSRKIRNTYQEMMPSAAAKVSIECSKCKAVHDTEVPLNADWFWIVG